MQTDTLMHTPDPKPGDTLRYDGGELIVRFVHRDGPYLVLRAEPTVDVRRRLAADLAVERERRRQAGS